MRPRPRPRVTTDTCNFLGRWSSVLSSMGVLWPEVGSEGSRLADLLSEMVVGMEVGLSSWTGLRFFFSVVSSTGGEAGIGMGGDTGGEEGIGTGGEMEAGVGTDIGVD